MPKNKGKGGKNRRRGKNDALRQKRLLLFKEDLQEYAQVTKTLGSGWFEANCFDGKQRRCHVRGSMKKRVWVETGDIVLVSLREYEDDKADIIHKYYEGEAVQLIRAEEIPDSVDLCYSASGVQEFEAEKDGFTVDFDQLGFMRDQGKYRRLRATGVLNYDDEDREYYESLQAEGLDISGPTH